MDLLCPARLDFDPGIPEICDMGVFDTWIPTNPMVVFDPFIIKHPAPKETEWEAKKPAIEHIYLTENQTLNATIIFMQDQHGFTATEKMYKRRFRLWGWYKYMTKGIRKEKELERSDVVSALLPSEACEPPRKKARVEEEPCSRSKPASTPSTLIPVDLKNFQQKATVFTAINQLLDLHVRTVTSSTGSCSSSKYRLLHGSSAPRLLDGFYDVLNALECKEKIGWEAMERILDQIHHHIEGGDILCFMELCFLIPRALLFSTKSRALRLYLSRLIQISQEKKLQGPLAEAAHLLQDIYSSQRGSGLLDLLVFASSAYAAALAEKFGKEDRKALLATWDSLRLAGQLDPTVASTWLGQWELLHKECMSRFGRHGLPTLGLEDDLSGLVQPTRLYPQASCPAEIGKLINGVRRKLFLIPGEESDSSSFEDDDMLFF